jgi:hypothetical protein
MSDKAFEKRVAEMKARLVRIFLLLEHRAGHTVDWSQVEGGRPANADEILASLGFGAGRAEER